MALIKSVLENFYAKILLAHPLQYRIYIEASFLCRALGPIMYCILDFRACCIDSIPEKLIMNTAHHCIQE